MPNSFFVEFAIMVIVIISWYIKEYFGLSMNMYIGLVFALIFMVFQKIQ